MFADDRLVALQAATGLGLGAFVAAHSVNVFAASISDSLFNKYLVRGKLSAAYITQHLTHKHTNADVYIAAKIYIYIHMYIYIYIYI